MLKITTGCMFAGKTNALIRDIPESSYMIIDYDTDYKGTPYTNQPHPSFLQSHDGFTVECIKTTNLDNLTIHVDSILINEAQFFKGLFDFVKMVLGQGKHIFIYGLDGDFKQQEFGEILKLIPLCDTYVKLYATCSCGKPAAFSKRISDNQEQYSPYDTYRPSCRQCLTYAV
jgi:thymidine kinase